MGLTRKALVIGSGPNGLAAAITLLRAGWQVEILEANPEVGGGVHSAELTLPGYSHDVCSSIYPFGNSSPFMSTIPWSELGVTWLTSNYSAAHPLEDGKAVVCARTIEETASALGKDQESYRSLYTAYLSQWTALQAEILEPMLHVPRSPLLLTKFGLIGLRSASALARSCFRSGEGRALFAGMAAHSVLPFDAYGSGAFGLVMQLSAHFNGWPFPSGGAKTIAAALAQYIEILGGRIRTGIRILSASELPNDHTVLFDVSPQNLVSIANGNFSDGFRKSLSQFKRGAGVCKVDWALKEPIPWTNLKCRESATVHVGGTLEEIEASEKAPHRGRHAERPFVLVTQPAQFDKRRSGKLTAWGYSHVPNGSTFDMTERIERQIERFAPGFRDVIAARHTILPQQFEAMNANLLGGDIAGGANNLAQLFARPTWGINPYRLPKKSWYLCSSSTPPGGGVHGMCGYNAAITAISDFK